MDMLFAAAAVFLGIHFLVSGTRLRDGIVGVIGERAYLGLFSLASLAAIFWLVISYNHAQAGGADPLLYDLGEGVKHLAMPVVLIAFLLAVPGLFTANPTSVKQEFVAAKPSAAKGILAITRHPFLWGVVIWSAYVFNMTMFADVRYAGVVFPVIGWWLYDIFYITPFLAIPYLHTVNREIFSD